MLGIIDSILIALIIALVIYLLLVKFYPHVMAQPSNMEVSPVGLTTGNNSPLTTHDANLKQYVSGLETGSHQYDSSTDSNSLLAGSSGSNVAMQQYKNKHFQFADFLNFNSNNHVDPVDQANQFVYSDFQNCNGQKIGDVYNKMVEVSNGTIAPPNKSNLNQASLSGNILSGGNGNMYDGYRWIVGSPNTPDMANDMSSPPMMAV
jgi:hypothetical protein